jgi:hypothetical protein
MSVQLENEFLSVSLPDGWVDRSDDEGPTFANPETGEELIISFLKATKRLDAGEVSDSVSRIIQARARAFGQLSTGTFTVLEATQSPPGVPSVVTFSGLNTKDAIYAKVMVMGHFKYVVSISYYLYKCGSVSKDTEARARAVIDMCRANTA